MKKSKTMPFALASIAVLFCLTLFVGAAQKPQGDALRFKKNQKTVHLISSLEGGDLFQAYCATCHGVTGKGDGPIASVLDTAVPDLTTITKRHSGLFPTTRVRSIIAGDDLIKAHGTREMPIWGQIFHQVERNRDLGNIRLENVTKYVEFLQEK